jgi:hypothetical protein
MPLRECVLSLEILACFLYSFILVQNRSREHLPLRKVEICLSMPVQPEETFSVQGVNTQYQQVVLGTWP